MPTISKKQSLGGLDQKKIPELLRQAQLIVENSYDAIISETLDGIITSWNGGATTMFGYTEKESIGKPMSFLVPRDKKDEVPTLLAKVKAGEVIMDSDSVRLRKDGSLINVAISVSPIKTKDGIIIGASVVERDITKRIKAEKRILELNEVRSKFITVISHQLRTPLTSVNWNLEMLLDGNFGKLSETQHEFLQATHAASIEITRRIHNLLTAIDVEEGRVVFETGDVDLNSLAAGVVAEMKNKCEMKGLSCVYTPPTTDTSNIIGDAEKIRMTIFSLMENAISYTKNGGKITASLQQKGDFVRLEVSDTGIGIPQTEQHLIFTRFFRASNAATMLTDAFGLGLFVARNVIEQHHGKIGFKSTEGKGSTFWLELPLKK